MERFTPPAHPSNGPPWRSHRGRLAAWLVLSLPLLIYVLVFPVAARLDLGEIESHPGASIWRTMAQNLPGVEVPTLLQAAFWFAALVFLIGALCMIWLALAGFGQRPLATIDQSELAAVDSGQGIALDDAA